MAYRPHGHAFANPSAPSAWGRCDRCGFIYNHKTLKFQFDYRGPQLQNLRFLVCDKCYDKPQAQLKPILTTQDPIPVLNARPDSYDLYNTNNISISAPTVTDFWTGIPIPSTIDIITEDGVSVTTQTAGRPIGLDQSAVMPLINNKTYRVTLNPLSVTSQSGTSTITVTFSSSHGLSTNDQIAVEGLSNKLADGFYSVTVTTATVFTYQVNSAIPVGGLLQGSTLMVTALIGIPNNYAQIPLTGV